jgi:hypothetical protein
MLHTTPLGSCPVGIYTPHTLTSYPYLILDTSHSVLTFCHPLEDVGRFYLPTENRELLGIYSPTVLLQDVSVQAYLLVFPFR